MSDNDEHNTNQPGKTPGPPKLTLVTSNGEDRAELEVSFSSQNESMLGSPHETCKDDSTLSFSPNNEHAEQLRVIEALLFASPDPLSKEDLVKYLPNCDHVSALLEELKRTYESRGINLVNIAGKWAFRTAKDLSHHLQHHAVETRRLSKAALETLAIIAYHQPVTRAEIEEIRGVTTSAGTLDILLETSWVRLRGRRRAPGRPVTYGTSEQFLSHFGLESIKDLPGLAELKGTGLLDSSLPDNFQMPQPSDIAALMPDELPLEDIEESEPDHESKPDNQFDDEFNDEHTEHDEEYEEISESKHADSNQDLPNTDHLDKPDPEPGSL